MSEVAVHTNVMAARRALSTAELTESRISAMVIVIVPGLRFVRVLTAAMDACVSGTAITLHRKHTPNERVMRPPDAARDASSKISSPACVLSVC